MKDIVICLVVTLTLFNHQSVSESASGTPPPHDVLIEATPTSVHDGFTKTLCINCTFLPGPASNFSTVLSMIVSKADHNGGKVFHDIADITSFARHTVEIKDSSLGANVKGQMVADTESYISFEWQYPSTAVLGTYKCIVHGMDQSGHPMAKSATAVVSEKEIDAEMLIGRIREIETDHAAYKVSTGAQLTALEASKSTMAAEIAELQAYKAKSEAQITSLEASKSVMAAQIADLQAFKTDMTTKTHKLRESIVEATASYNGHTYYLSKPIARDISAESVICWVLGGYVAEVNDVSEYNFVESFIRNDSRVVEHVHIGAFNEGTVGKWTYLRSRNSAYLNWYTGEPNTDGEHCVAVVRNMPGMHDVYCDNHQFGRFICEIPA